MRNTRDTCTGNRDLFGFLIKQKPQNFLRCVHDVCFLRIFFSFGGKIREEVFWGKNRKKITGITEKKLKNTRKGVFLLRRKTHSSYQIQPFAQIRCSFSSSEAWVNIANGTSQPWMDVAWLSLHDFWCAAVGNAMPEVGAGDGKGPFTVQQRITEIAGPYRFCRCFRRLLTRDRDSTKICVHSRM